MSKPLALKLAPKSISEVIGQKHLVGDGKILSNLLFDMLHFPLPVTKIFLPILLFFSNNNIL